MRIAIRFAYDGRFAGYARQPEGDTVEDHLIAALDHEGFQEGSWRTGSRTDRGVAAIMNVAACDVERPHLDGFVPAVQRHLPEGIWCTGVASVPASFDPRKASWRQYTYLARAGGEDLAAMQAACHAFEGTHDVTAFARLESHRDPCRTVLACTVAPNGAWWRFQVRGQSFLWNQVRRMVDAVLTVGRGDLRPSDIRSALKSGTKPPACSIAPAGGLLLDKVQYEPAPEWVGGALPHRGVQRFAQSMQVQATLADALMALR